MLLCGFPLPVDCAVPETEWLWLPADDVEDDDVPVHRFAPEPLPVTVEPFLT